MPYDRVSYSLEKKQQQNNSQNNTIFKIESHTFEVKGNFFNYSLFKLRYIFSLIL